MDLIKKITELYDREVLSKELGDSPIRQQLIQGLEGVLSKINLPSEIPEPLPIHDKLIDYKAIEAQSRLFIATRINTVLKRRNIVTYGDLARAVQHSKYELHGEESYRRYIEGLFLIGQKSTDALLQHLRDIQFDYDRKPVCNHPDAMLKYDSPINYELIGKMEKSAKRSHFTVKRIRQVLDELGVSTYQDLVDKVRGRLSDRDFKGKISYMLFFDATRIRNNHTMLEMFYLHLQAVGFDYNAIPRNT